jgi:Reverse transcriptase (RNA-dependent DNA polymerase)/Retroviral aspartyl protease
MSSTLANQLRVKRKTLDTPLGLQLAVQGSWSKINTTTEARLQCQGINSTRHFDIINLNSYDITLGMPWLYQHKVCIGLNPSQIIVGCDHPELIHKGQDTKLMVYALSIDEQWVETVRAVLHQHAEPLCREVDETDLFPLRAINHTIPLIDKLRIYPWQPSKCPRVFRTQWAEKRDAYLKSGQWKVTSLENMVPMLLIPKPKTMPVQLHTVVDLRERNKNMHRLTSPLPDIEGMLRRTASKPFCLALDLKSAYKQIRIVLIHVNWSTVTTPDGNMVSQVIQIGDCNAPATYQVLMNHLFSSYIGRFMDVYLDNIVVYSNSLEDHVEHVKIVLDILRKEKLYLSKGKLRLIADKLCILGWVIDDKGIWMDPDKVDSVLKWKMPTN